MRYQLVLIMALLLFSAGCGQKSVKMATTTSTENSGLLDYLLPIYKEGSGVKIDVIAVGTGKALKLGENGDVDIVLVHAKKAEEAFVAAGYGTNRKEVMFNDFIIIGPAKDPVKLKRKATSKDVFSALGKGKASFLSRGDNSGTHMKEKSLWQLAGIQPIGKWYMETGQGMGATLNVANEKQAYCLVDRGTWLAFKDKLDLVIVFEDVKSLKNIYGIMLVNPERHSHVKDKLASDFAKWITSHAGQTAIDKFRLNGERLFHPIQKVGSDVR